jgi:hypothetical protein
MITILNLSNNQIADEGTKHLAKVLPYNTVSINITSTLSLHPYCYIQTITTLDLTNNQIGDSGAQSLFKALEENKVNVTVSSSLPLTFSLLHTDTHRNSLGIQPNQRSRQQISRFHIGQQRGTSLFPYLYPKHFRFSKRASKKSIFATIRLATQPPKI